MTRPPPRARIPSQASRRTLSTPRLTGDPLGSGRNAGTRNHGKSGVLETRRGAIKEALSFATAAGHDRSLSAVTACPFPQAGQIPDAEENLGRILKFKFHSSSASSIVQLGYQSGETPLSSALSTPMTL